MASSSAENSNSFTGPTITWSSVIPTQWCSISRRVSIVRQSVMVHPHSAGWSSGDWHRPIINLPFHWCSLGFFLLFFLFFFFFLFSFFFFPFFSFLFLFFYFYSVLLIFKLFFIYFLLLFFFLLSFLFFSAHLYFLFFLSVSPLQLFIIWVCASL